MCVCVCGSIESACERNFEHLLLPAAYCNVWAGVQSVVLCLTSVFRRLAGGGAHVANFYLHILNIFRVKNVFEVCIAHYAMRKCHLHF